MVLTCFTTRILCGLEARLGFGHLSPKEADVICLKATWMGSGVRALLVKKKLFIGVGKAVGVWNLTRILIRSQKILMLIKKGPGQQAIYRVGQK